MRLSKKSVSWVRRTRSSRHAWAKTSYIGVAFESDLRPMNGIEPRATKLDGHRHIDTLIDQEAGLLQVSANTCEICLCELRLPLPWQRSLPLRPTRVHGVGEALLQERDLASFIDIRGLTRVMLPATVLTALPANSALATDM